MKNFLVGMLLLFSTVLFSQIPKNFTILEFNDSDSALIILNKLARQQIDPAPFNIEITKEYISQDRNTKKTNAWTFNSRTIVASNAIYFETITHVKIRDYSVYKIYYISDVTGKEDVLMFKDRRMAEKAYAALICLIRNSENEYFK